MTAFRSNVLQPGSIFPLWWHVKYFPFESWHQRGSAVQKGVTARTLLRVHFHPHPPQVLGQWGDGKAIQGCLSTCRNSHEGSVGRRHTCFYLSSSRDLMFQAPEEQECPGNKVRGTLWWWEGCTDRTGQGRHGRGTAGERHHIPKEEFFAQVFTSKRTLTAVGWFDLWHTHWMGSSEPHENMQH